MSENTISHEKHPESTLDEDTVQFVSEPSFSGCEAPTPSQSLANQSANQEGSDPHIDEFQRIASQRWDDSRPVVQAYIQDLEKRNDEKGRQLLARALKNGAPYTQALACSVLHRMGTPAVEILVKNLIRPDGSTHPDVFRSLKKIGKNSVPVLIDMLRDNHPIELDPEQKIRLVEILGFYRQTKVSEVLCQFLLDSNKDLRHAAADALQQQGRAAEKGLIKLLKSQKGYLCRKSCIYLLGRLRSRRAVPVVLEYFMGETNDYLLTLQSWALGQMGSSEAIGPLIFMLDDPSQTWLVRRSIIRTLGRLGQDEVVETLLPYLEDRHLRESVVEALGNLGGKKTIKALRKVMKSEITYLRYLAMSALAHIGDRNALQLMLEGLIDPDPFVQNQTDKAFRQIYSEDEVEEIYYRLENRERRREKLKAWAGLAGKEMDEGVDEDWNDLDEFEEEGIDPKPRKSAAPTKTHEHPFPPSLDSWRQTPRKKSLLQKLRDKAERKLEEIAAQMPQPQQQGMYPDHENVGGGNLGAENYGGQDPYGALPPGPRFGKNSPWS